RSGSPRKKMRARESLTVWWLMAPRARPRELLIRKRLLAIQSQRTFVLWRQINDVLRLRIFEVLIHGKLCETLRTDQFRFFQFQLSTLDVQALIFRLQSMQLITGK